MKKIQIVFLIAIFSCFTLQSQDLTKAFGAVSKEELEKNHYELDKDAEAIVLFDVGKSYFIETSNSFDVVFERTTRIKILSKAGIKWAEVEIPFYQEGEIYEMVSDLEAYSYNYENGMINKVPFSASNVYDEKINNFWNVKKFAIPDVKEGSIIEYKYRIVSQYKFNLRDWEFQWKIPVLYSEYEVKMIPFYEYTWLLQGASKLDVYETYKEKGIGREIGPKGRFNDNTYNDVVFLYGMKNVPAFEDEEFITSINDYIIKIDFQLSKVNHLNGISVDIISTWPDLTKELLKNSDFGGYVSKSEKLSQKLFDAESLSGKTENEKFNYVLDYVKKNYNWNRKNDKYASKSANDFIDEKVGNCADINLFTIGLLNSVGIEAYPLLISTREHGKIKYDYPYTHFFNYVLIFANVNGKNVISDATEVMSLNNRIPERCINDKGLIIKKDQVEWVLLESSFPSQIYTIIKIDLENKQISADITKQSTEYDALYYRNNYGENIETILKQLNSKNYVIKDSSITVFNQHIKERPYILNYSVIEKAEIINDKIYISPFLNESISETSFKQKERKNPIDMTYPIKRSFKSIISIPDGYQVDFTPEDQIIKNQLFELNYSVNKTDNSVSIIFDYYFKNSVYSADDYSKIKFYFNEIVKKGNEKIVLSKINEEISSIIN
ncbi:MAG TPA: DUF3857 and transglutaminase domain-containing protein [Bacteroidales bacterium]